MVFLIYTALLLCVACFFLFDFAVLAIFIRDKEQVMCLAIPGKLVRIFENTGLKMGEVDYDGTVSQVCLEYVPEIALGQYTVVHAGFALSILDEEEAQKTLALWQELLEKADQQRENDGRSGGRQNE